MHVCTRWGKLKGTDESARFRQRTKADYERAKRHSDFEAAGRLVTGLMKRADTAVDRLIDQLTPFIRRGVPLACVVPHPSFDDEDGSRPDVANSELPRNAIPLAFAAHLAALLGCEVDGDILEKERVGRTKLTKLERFLWQPSFTGPVRTDVAYVVADDVLTLGGTIAALRSYIVANGGTVASCITLAHHTGKQQNLALRTETWDVLVSLYGADVHRFWKEEVGHGANCLTEAEGQFLVDWARETRNRRRGLSLLQCLRACLSEAATTNRQSLGAGGGP